MKARTKITLWTSSFALVVAITFSAFVFYELIEQPFRLIDREIRDLKNLTSREISAIESSHSPVKELTEHPFDRYWLEVKNEQDQIVLQSQMTHHVDISRKYDKKFYFDKKDIALEHIWIAEEDKNEIEEIAGQQVFFRVLHDNIDVNNEVYFLLIARPIPIEAHDVRELAINILYVFLFFSLVAVLGSYHLAGMILRPLSEINLLVQEINDRSLHKRLPVGENMDELNTLSLSLNDMFDHLQYSFARQKEFIGNASHELKSPLAILMLGHEKILSEVLPETIRAGLGRQLETMQRLSRLVRTLLQLSRLEQHESLKSERIDLNQLVLHVIEEFADILKEKAIQLHSQRQKTSFLGDPDKILQVLINLLDNAIKYNLPRDGKIWITVENTKDFVNFSIANTGETIPKESLEKIFEQFYRVEQSRSTVFGGAGLGLTIVKQIVHLHHASIGVTSNSAGVTTFSISFPAKAH